MDYKGVNQTPWMELEKFKEYMGIERDQYPQFKELNKFVIKKAIKEINAKTDLWVEVEYKREKRKIVALKFLIKGNPNKPENLRQLPLPFPETDEESLEQLSSESDLTQESSFPSRPEPPLPEIPDHPLVKELILLNLSEKQSASLLQQYTEEDIQRAIQVVKTSPRPIKNPGAFIAKALKDGWEFSERYDPMEAARKEQEERERKEREKLEAKRKQEEHAREEFWKENSTDPKYLEQFKEGIRKELEPEEYQGWIDTLKVMKTQEKVIFEVGHPVFERDIKKNHNKLFQTLSREIWGVTRVEYVISLA